MRAILLVLVACSKDGADTGTPSGSDSDTDTGTDTPSASSGFDPSYLSASVLAESVTEESCTLSGGTETTCYRITITGEPDHDLGPFCPRSIEDTSDDAGIWIDGGEVYDADGDFIVGLAEFYGDDSWQLYDESTGEVYVTDTYESCDGAARPEVEEQYQNHCVECDLSYLDSTELTVLIPKAPVAASSSGTFGRGDRVGLSLSGAIMDPPAPTDAILGAHTIAPFDDFGGHINPETGYHYHGHTGLTTEIDPGDGHAGLIGVAMDGYGLYAMADADGTEPGDLDSCRGHTDDVRGYHYHVASAGENQFIGCFHGETGSVQ